MKHRYSQALYEISLLLPCNTSVVKAFRGQKNSNKTMRRMVNHGLVTADKSVLPYFYTLTEKGVAEMERYVKRVNTPPREKPVRKHRVVVMPRQIERTGSNPFEWRNYKQPVEVRL